MIPFNQPYFTGKETNYIAETLSNKKTSGNGPFTKKCQHFFEEKYNFPKTLLTTSCTDALEMAAILANIEPGDEIIIPSYTFVSTAIAFIRQGAKIVFADSYENNPNIDATKIEALITNKTKVIVPVHYAGLACDMDTIMDIANKYNLLVIEDAAQAIDSYYINKHGEKKALGGIGHFGAYSFHDTKNIISGEGGLLIINDKRFIKRAEIIWEKGTNRSEFLRGEVNKYGWVDVGSSFLPSEVTAAFLWAQLEEIQKIQSKRILLWNTYYNLFSDLNSNEIKLPIKTDNNYNGHMFYIVAKNIDHRDEIIDNLKANGFHSVFHYLSLHKSPYFKDKYSGETLVNSDEFTDCLIRLPLFYELEELQIKKLVDSCFSKNK